MKISSKNNCPSEAQTPGPVWNVIGSITTSTKTDQTSHGQFASGQSGRRVSGTLFQNSRLGLAIVLLLVIVGVAGASWTGVLESGTQRLESDADQLAANRREIEAMDSRQLNDLQAQKNRFDKLKPIEQDRLRQLYAALQSHPDKAELETIVLRYMDWLKSLNEVDKAVVLDKRGDERLAEICRIRCQPGNKQTVLSPSDNIEFESWFRFVAESRKTEIAEALDRVAERRTLKYRPDKTAPPEAVFRYLFVVSGAETAKILTPEVIASLNQRLSSRGQEILQHGDSVRAVKLLVFNPVSDYEIRRFFEDKLSQSQREELDRLKPEETRRQLRWLYFRSQLGLASKQN